MVYDEYLNLSGLDLVPFINPEEDGKVVYRVVSPIKNGPVKATLLDLKIHNEKDGYYLYLAVYEADRNPFGYSIAPHVMKKILVAEKTEKASQRSYYWAALKASIFAKDIVKEVIPQYEVDWTALKIYEAKMSRLPFYARYGLFEKEWYPFSERKFWNSVV